MIPEVDGREQAEELALVDLVYHANVQLAIIEARSGRDLHAAAIGWGVGKGGQENGNAPAGDGWRGLRARQRDLGKDRGVVEECRKQAERIAAIPPQPARQSIGPPRHFAIQANARDGREVVSVGRGCRTPIATREGCDDPQVDRPDIAPIGQESAPGRQCIADLPESQGARKIIPAAAGHNQHGQSQPHQIRQIAVRGAISAEDQNGVRGVRVDGHAAEPGGS